jgi:hypothetical protein
LAYKFSDLEGCKAFGRRGRKSIFPDVGNVPPITAEYSSIHQTSSLSLLAALCELGEPFNARWQIPRLLAQPGCLVFRAFFELG